MPDIILNPRNQLLAALPPELRQRLTPHLKTVYLPQGGLLHEQRQTPRSVCFPATAVISIGCMASSGEGAEISMIGNDGMVDVAAFLAGDSSATVASVQAAGHACMLDMQRLRDEIGRSAAALGLLLRHTQAQMFQVARIAVCNRHHPIDRQLCRWLLRFDDFRPGQRLPVTHEQIANMLGVRRENISRATAKLQRLGVIRCGRSEITVIERQQLEQLSCDCYHAVRNETARLLPLSIDAHRVAGHARPDVHSARYPVGASSRA